ncbi:hypothetical protein PRIPAC_72929 [Pristionchus pacificus]|uniref:Uncharacterized protein n=1 Tax=Pristionchus pacificus TaxID=54126 RepID=A0A2A6CZ87_PRIPA|nr:hypothetical protein PRIPAC_72929 [Pristionchus pacificus]|eukprot:PDM83532.1 hypothetical protein PRIPAC_30019 [Pristionchus pacificus]
MRTIILISLVIGVALMVPFQSKNTVNIGIAGRINQMTLDYIAEQTSEALHHLLENASLPTIEGSRLTFDYVRIYEFKRPIIDVHFVEDKGITVNVVIPRAFIMGQATFHFITDLYNDHFQLTIENKTVTIESDFSRDPKEDPVKINHCFISDNFVRAIFDGSITSWGPAHSRIESKINSEISDLICQTAVNELLLLVKQPLKDVPEVVSDFAHYLCTPEHEDVGTFIPSTPSPSPRPSLLSTLSTSLRSWGINLQMPYMPTFTHQHVTLGLNGGITYDGKLPRIEPPPSFTPNQLGDKMFGLLISDYVPNTAIVHILNKGQEVFEFDIARELIPSVICSIDKVICSDDIHVRGKFNSTRQSSVVINENGSVHVVLAGATTLVISNRKKDYEIKDATGYMNLILHSNVTNNQMFASIELPEARIKVRKLIEKDDQGVLSNNHFGIERMRWKPMPEMETKGFKLPDFCGLHLSNPSIEFVNRAVILQTDITYDTHLFIRKFKRFANSMMEAKNQRRLYQYFENYHLAMKIINEWNEELSPLSSPSSITSTSDESCDSSDVFPTGKRRISHCKPIVKKARVEEEVDYWKYSDEEAEKEYKRFSDRVDEAIKKNIIAHPSSPSYAGSLADFVYGDEERNEKEDLPVPKKSKVTRPKTVAPIKKTIRKPTPLMNKALKMAGRK